MLDLLVLRTDSLSGLFNLASTVFNGYLSQTEFVVKGLKVFVTGGTCAELGEAVGECVLGLFQFTAAEFLAQDTLISGLL